jgi:endonuclease/exonuclease/phosphatase family metal-dependent hydrolase
MAHLLTALLVTALGIPAATAAPPGPVRFVTLNILHGGPLSGWNGKDQHLDSRLDLVTDALLRLHPDVVALQEASWSRGRGEVASRLAGRLGMNHVYAPASTRLFDTAWLNRLAAGFLNFTEGPSILSRFPIVGWEALRLPDCGRRLEPRVLLFAELETPSGRLPVFSTHTAGDPCHTRAVAALVRERRGDLPGVLMGDLNAVESSPAVAVLSAEAGFVDAFRAARPEAPGFTVWQPVTAPGRRAFRRVDYVFLVPGRAFPGAVVDSRVVIDAPGRLPDGTVLWPSDHYGVLADLAVFPPAPLRAAGEDGPGAGPAGSGRPAAAGRGPDRRAGSGVVPTGRAVDTGTGPSQGREPGGEP